MEDKNLSECAVSFAKYPVVEERDTIEAIKIIDRKGGSEGIKEAKVKNINSIVVYG